MKKRMVALLMTGAMTAGVLTGCTGSDTVEAGSTAAAGQTDTAAAATAQTETASTAAAADAKTEIEFWYSGGKTAVGVIQEIIDSYNASQDLYTVTAVTQASYDETYQKLQAGIAGNAAPDLALLDATVARSLSDKELVADLSDMIAADSEFDQADYLEVFYNQGVDENGKVYALPAYGTTQVLYYNMAAFEAADIQAEEIKTWQDLAAAAKKIKETGSYEYGWEPMWGADNLIDAAFSNGAEIFNEDGTQVTINTAEWVDVWEAFRTWIHDDEIMAIHSGGQGWEYWYSTIDDVIAGTAGGYTGSSGDQADLDFSIVAAMEQPAWDTDSASAPMAEALTLSVLQGSDDAEKQGAYDFMKYFTNAESQTKWTMATGYVAVNTKVNENADYQAYVAENPQAGVPLAQASHGSVYPFDPTNGAIIDALKIAADKVEIDGVSAQEALDEAQATAQAALDEALGQ